MADKFAVVKKGYSIEEVDLYVADMEQKMEYFKSRETAVTKAIVSAQETAEQVIRNAELDSREIIFECQMSLNDIRKMVESEKCALSEFCKEYDDIVRKYFSGTAEEITAPLNEKINMLTQMLEEKDSQQKRAIMDKDKKIGVGFKTFDCQAKNKNSNQTGNNSDNNADNYTGEKKERQESETCNVSDNETSST